MLLSQPRYLQPASLDEALAALAAGRRTVLAGGTDFYPARISRSVPEDILDISRLAGLRGIARDEAGWRLGALSTWSELIREPLPPLFDGLKQAAREIGGVQIQNAGTLSGNLCNASPAADGVPPLLALSAQVELRSVRGARCMSLADFVIGNRATACAHDELVSAIHVPAHAQRTRSAFVKLGARRYLVISIASVAVTLESGADGQVISAGVAVGACSPVPRRLPALERRLIEQPCDAALAAVPRSSDLDELAPISDVRGSAAYRQEAVLTLMRRALGQVAG
jgi:CO/xanthine dehydrogenase FAD-binding subunit